jgi:hypothetical protein
MAQQTTEVGTERDVPLNWDVLVTPGIAVVTSDLARGTKQGMWSPISSTLIYGKRDAVLVDTFITVEQADILVDWVAASGKNLTTIYATPRFRPRSRNNDDRARTLRQDAGARSGSGQSRGSALAYGARRQTVIFERSEKPHIAGRRMGQLSCVQ